MKILITGATGFVGTWLTKKFLDLGHDLRVMTRSGRTDFPFHSEKIEVVRGDVCDLPSTLRATKNIHSVFHLAGVVGYSQAMRNLMHQTNVIGTAHVIEACQQSQCKKIIHLSSVAAIGASFDGRKLLDESSEYNLKSLDLGYFETKREGEMLVSKATQQGLPAVILNPSTIYGAGDATKMSRSTQVKVARGKFPFYSSGGVNVIHIDDLINAIHRAWEVGRIGERYIISAENLTIKKLFQIIADEAGVKRPSIYLPNAAIRTLGKIGDLLEKYDKKGPLNSENANASMLFHWFDNAKSKRELGLNPRPAQNAIRDSVQWMKENKII